MDSILTLVREKFGLKELNSAVKKLLTQWLLSILQHERDLRCSDAIVQESDDLNLAKKCADIGKAFEQFESYDEAMVMFQKCLLIREKKLVYDDVGAMMKLKGDLDGSLAMFQKCLLIREKKR